MGEIKIKSGNLFNVNSSSVDGYIDDNGNIAYAGYPIKTYDYINIIKDTNYTLVFNKSPSVSTIRIAWYDDEYNFIKRNVNNTGTYIIKSPSNASYCRLSIDVGLTNIQLLEGTYTSETIPEYQPYFLNRPAHQFTNGQWVDIPTHHFINGRWQGELTSQSPLKFRADGEMLDWRVEGKTSGNLFDVNGEHTSLVWDGKECLVIENDAIIVNQIRPGYMTGIYYDEVYKPGTYTFAMKQLAAQSGKTEIRVVSSAPFAGGAYNDAYKAYTAALVKHDDTHYITIVVTEPTEIGFFINWVFSVNDKIYDIQLLEGTYTAGTLPPYEPYGGVGDWDETAQKYRIPVTVNGATTTLYTDHQLMDGDSIDYATNQTTIPLATGNNTLSVDTAVQPKSVFVKFEG